MNGVLKINIIIDHIPVDNYRRKGLKMKPTYITIHSTANTNSYAKGERKWLISKSNTRQASWHYCVDEKEIIEAIPANEVAFHSGNETGNYNSISIEMCESGNRKKVINNTIELTKKLSKKYNISIDNIVRHYDWSKKNCPRILNYNNWQGWIDFKRKLSDLDHWSEKYFQNLNKNGIKINEKRFDDSITRGEIFALLDRVVEKIENN
jgi:N-acetylmuramoyl-L-alanine amidase